MADRYWVGGTGNRNDSAHWSGTSGGPGGASVPTSADNAFIDSNSGTGTWDCDVADFYCSNLTISTTSMVAGGATVPGVSKTIRIYGNLTISQASFFNSNTDLTPHVSDAIFLFSNTILQIVNISNSTKIYAIEALSGSVVRFDGFFARTTLSITASGTASVTINGWVQAGFGCIFIDTAALSMNSLTRLYFSNQFNVAATCSVSCASDSFIYCIPNDSSGLDSYFTGNGKTYGRLVYNPSYSTTYLITDFANLIMSGANTFSKLDFGLGDDVNSRLELIDDISVTEELAFYRYSSAPYTAPYRLYVAPYGAPAIKTINVLPTTVFGISSVSPAQPIAFRLTPSYITISGSGGRLFPAFTSNGCVDGGNNSGWYFGSSGFPILFR